jgi:hypothetical protein
VSEQGVLFPTAAGGGAGADGWHPDELIGHGAVHGGSWRRPSNLRSTLVYTAVLGMPQAYARFKVR